MDRRRDPERPDPATPSRERIRESIVERQIRDAMDEGRFDDLPHRGARLSLPDDSAAGDRAIAHRVLKNAGMAPAWIEADQTVRALLAERDGLLTRPSRLSSLARTRARADLVRVVEAANRAILRVNVEAPTERQHRRMLDIDTELARLERAFRGEAPR